jgi:glycerol-3-phosphate acyltransferase PlsY
MDAGFLGMYIAGVVAAYLLGAVPFGLLIGLWRGIDIRQHGSKNIGANNVARTVGRPWGVLTFTLDAAKGAGPIILGGWWLGVLGERAPDPTRAWMWMSFGAAAFLGHLFPIFLKFKGGKGVATGFGALLAVYPIVTFPALLAIVSWATCVKITRYVGLSSSVASAVLALLTMIWPAIMHAWSTATRQAAESVSWATQLPFVVTTTLLAVLVIYRHRGNFRRMIDGTEPRVGGRKPAATTPAN